MKYLCPRLYIALLFSLLISILPFSSPPSYAAVFAYGADIGWTSQLEANGITWNDDHGVTDDPLKILHDHGINAVRLRVFVNPAADGMWNKDNTTMTMLGYADKAHVLSMAQRAQQQGMQIMVDFHYSDVFADPGHQIKPAAWQNDNLAQLTNDVYNHTYDVMSTLVSEGITPAWAQVGNEINSGILLPTGSSNNFSNLTQLLNAGYDAVKAASPTTKVVTHLAHGTNNATARWFFDNFLTNQAGKTDIIGFSYYPYWEGANYWDLTGDLAANLNDMASRYNKEVMVVEIGGDETDPHDSYWTIFDTISALKAVPNHKGIGLFYWEPEANSHVLTDGYQLGMTSQISAHVLQFTHALDAFTDGQFGTLSNNSYQLINRHSHKLLNVTGGSTYAGAYLEQYSNGNWDSQRFFIENTGQGYVTIENANSHLRLDLKDNASANGTQIIQQSPQNSASQQWQLLDAGNGYYKIRNRMSGKLLDIEAHSTENDALCIAWPDNGGANQQWQFEP